MMNQISYSPSLSSTNDELKRQVAQLQEEKFEFDSLRAGFQTKGRGQKNNTWISDPDKNILLSTLFYPQIFATEQFKFNMIYTIAIARFLTTHLQQEVAIKWPNDIYICHQKIAGILIEHTIVGTYIKYTIAGIGLNVNQTIYPDNLPNPISMTILTGKNYLLDTLSQSLLDIIKKTYNQYITKKYDEVKSVYMSFLYQYRQMCSYQDKIQIFQARIVDVDDFGRLVVERDDGQRVKYAFKELIYR